LHGHAEHVSSPFNNLQLLHQLIHHVELLFWSTGLLQLHPRKPLNTTNTTSTQYLQSTAVTVGPHQCPVVCPVAA
jgi:hypothetical protein